MGRTLAIEYYDVMIWSSHVVSSVYSGLIIDFCSNAEVITTYPWIDSDIEQWKVSIEVNEFGFHLNEDWSRDELELIISIFEKVNGFIRNSEEISSDQICKLNMSHGLHIDMRGALSLSSEVLAVFGEALVSMFKNEFRPPTERGWWFYGEDGRSFLANRSS